MSKMQAIPLISILVYVLITMIIGLLPYGKKRVDTIEEFHSATGSVGSAAMIMCLMSTIYTSSTWTAWVALSANTGVFATYTAAYMGASGILYYFIASKVYPAGREHNAFTIGSFLYEKYKSRGIQYIAAVISLTIACIWIIMEIKTLGYVIDVAFNNRLNGWVTLLLGLLIILVYILWGGLESVIWTSCLQGSIVIFGGILLCILLFHFQFSSISEFQSLFLKNWGIAGMEGPGEGTMNTGIAKWMSYVFLGATGMICLPQLFPRMYMGKNVNVQKKMAIAISASGIWCFSFVLIGFMAIAMKLETNDSQVLVFTMVKSTENIYVISFTYVLLLAASMGTLDITLLSAATILTTDMMQNLFKSRNIFFSQSHYVGLSRIIIIVVSAVCVLAAANYKGDLINLALGSYEVIAQLFPIVVCACICRRCSTTGAFVGLGTGLTVILGLKLSGWEPFHLVPGFLGLLANGVIIFLFQIFEKRGAKTGKE